MKPPSFHLRVALALFFLVGFYLVMIGVALILLAVPLGFVLATRSIGTSTLIVCAVCWIPALLVLRGIVTVTPPPFTRPGLPVTPADAPALFALIADLAEKARTAPPTEVYLVPKPTLAVTETGGMFSGKRVLIIGMPLLELITVQELSAGLAHELGHFAGGDTRLGGILSYTHSSFASVFDSVQRDAFRSGTSHMAIEAGFGMARALGEGLTKGYAHLYFLVMRASSRRQELAADALAAALAGRAATMRLLEKASLASPTYHLYLTLDVGFAVRSGVMPTDLLAGYRAFRSAFDAMPFGVQLADEVRAAKTDKFDSHPATAVRMERLAALPEGPNADDARPALSLWANAAPAHDWLVETTMNAFQSRHVLARATWEEIPRDVYMPKAAARANALAAELFPMFPEARTVSAMFVSVVKAFERGETMRVLALVEPKIVEAPPAVRESAIAEVGGGVLAALFEGALLERGGTMGTSFGAPSLVVNFENEEVPATKIAGDAMRVEGARALLGQWASRLAS